VKKNLISPRSAFAKSSHVAFILLLGLLSASLTLHAATMYWDPAGVTSGNMDGNGTWSASNTNWYNGSTAGNQWSNTTADTAVFGSANSNTTVYTVTVSGTVNAGTITFADINKPVYLYGPGTIHGPTGGTFYITNPTGVFWATNGATFANLNFTGASNYQFDALPGTVSSPAGWYNINGNSFAGNVVLGNGTDAGMVQWSQTGNPVGNNSIIVNSGTLGGWSLYLNNGTYTSNLKLNSLGGKLGGLGAYSGGATTWAGNITLGADASIMMNHGASAIFTVSGNIGGIGNLYLGSNSAATAGQFSQLVISGSNNYVGATILGNFGGGMDASGIFYQPVVLGANNTLPARTTLVLGETENQAPYPGMASPDTTMEAPGSSWWNSDGALDLHGFNQTVAGLAVGAGRTGANQFIGNWNNGTTSILTITGTTTPVSGFAGNITDHFGVSGSTGVVALTVGPGGFLTLTGTNSYSGATTVAGGTLKLDFSVSGAPTSNIINNVSNGSALVLNTGTLSLVQKASTSNSQQFNGLTVNAGQSSVVLTGATGNTLVLNLGTITDNVGGVVDFTLPSGSQSSTNGITTSNGNDTYGLLGGWATISGTSFAAVSSGNIVAYSGYVISSDVSTWGSTNIGVISANASFVNSMGASGTIGALRLTAASAGSANLGGYTLTIADGAVLVTSSATGATSINNGTLTSGTSQLTVDENASGTFTIGASIANNGANSVALTKNGPGELQLSGSNSYSGGTTINSGTLQMGNAYALGAAGSPLTINNATLDLNGSSVTSGLLSGLAGGLITDSGAAASLTVNSSGTSTYNGSINNGVGTLGLTMGGPGMLTLSASNNYSGPTAINGGILALGNAWSLGNTSAVSFNGGTLQYSSVNQADISGKIVSSGSAILLNTNGQNITFASGIASSNTGGLTVSGGGTLTLTASNSYSGPTTVTSGTLQLGDGVTNNGYVGGNIAVTGALIVANPNSETLPGNISGAASLTKSGVGVLTLGGSNSYSGGTTINAGVLSLSNTSAIGNSGNITFGGGALQYGSFNTTDYSSRIVNSGSAIVIDTNGQNVTFASAIASSNTGGFTKNGAGTLLMTANDNYTGTTTINGGTIQMGGAAYSSPFNTGLVVINSGGTLDLAGIPTYFFPQGIAGTGLVTSSSGDPYLGVWGSNWTQTFGGTLNNVIVDFGATNATWTLSGSSGNLPGGFTVGHVAQAGVSTVIITGTLSAGSIYAGHQGAGNIIVNGGLVNTPNVRVGNWGSGSSIGIGSFVLNSGTVIAPTVDSDAASSTIGTNTFQLNGGLLETSLIVTESGSNAPFTFTMNGGTILVTAGGQIFKNGGTTDGNEVAVQIGAGGGFINTNGFTTTSQRPITDAAGAHGMLTTLGAGTLILSNTGSWSGGTAINGGILNLNNQYALPTTGTISFGGGTLQYSSSNQVDFSSQIASSGSAISIDTNSQNVTFASALPATNVGGLAKLGAGQLTLSGSNSYSGGTIITGGTLQAANAKALGSAPASLAINAGTLDLDGNSLNVTTLGGSSGGLITSSSNANLTLTVSGAGNGTYNGVIQNGSGTLSLTKNGAGALTLGGVDTYTGSTLINGGVLGVSVSGALSANTNITFGGGTLKYIGNTTDYSSQIVNSGSAVSIDTGNVAPEFYTPLAASNSGGLTVLSSSGNGTLTVISAQVYTGPTTITSGALYLGDNTGGDDVSSMATSGILDNALLEFRNVGTETNSIAISGTGTVEMYGTGVEIFSGSNSYSGGTLINSGVLNYTNSYALGAGPVTFTGPGTLQAGVSGTLASLGANPGITGTFDTQSNNVATTGGLSGAGNVAKIGSGALTLTGSSSNTGTLFINGGIVNVGSANALSSTVGTITFGGGTLQYSSANQVDYSSRIANSGSAITIDTNGQNVTFASAIANTNTGGFTKNGAGTLLIPDFPNELPS
jgi:autotransporter-associated beta strand protein